MEKAKKNIIVRLQDFLETKQGQTVLNYLYSWGAAIVILGALFKLTHIKGADLMLFIGMGTEVLVFFISGFDRQASTLGGGEEGSAAGPVVIGGGIPASGAPIVGAPAVGVPSAALSEGVAAGEGSTVNPEMLTAMANLAAANAAAAAVANGPVVVGGSVAAGPVVVGGGAPAAAEGVTPCAAEGVVVSGGAAVAGPAVIGEAPTIIGHGGTVDIPEVEKVTNEYINNLRELSEEMNRVAEKAKTLEMSAEEMERLSRNLTSINTIYELHLKSLGSQIGNIDNVNEQTQRMADQIEELNAVYKRMLESMTVNMGPRSSAPATDGE